MLTDFAIKALKPGPKPYKRSDGGGLFLLINPNGRKYWRLGYRFEDRQKGLGGGVYPQVSLADARAWRDVLKKQLSAGEDPAEKVKAQKRAAKGLDEVTFETVANEWLKTRKPSWSPRYAALVEGRFKADIFPRLGQRRIARIETRDMLEAIRKIEKRGALEMASRVLNHCSEIFRFARVEGRCKSNPCEDISIVLTKRGPVKHRAKVTAEELPAFYVRLSTDEGERLSHLALRWTMLTMVRTQETRFALWSEFEGLDTDNPLWRISPERMKMRAEHLVPLPPQALALLKEIREINPYVTAGPQRFGKYLFPVATSKSGVISENRMLDIMYRIGLRGKATVHGFRGLASTVLNESGLFEPDWIEMQLAHQPGGVRGAYNSARYLAHRKELMRWWANYLDEAEANGMRQSTPLSFGRAA